MCFPMRRTPAMRLCSSVAAISRAEDFSGSRFRPSQIDSITSPETRLASPRAMVSTSGSSGMTQQCTRALGKAGGVGRQSSGILKYRGGLILQRYNRLAVAAEGGYFLQIPVGLGQGHHRPVAVNRMAVSGEVPASDRGVLLQVTGWLAHWLCRLRRRHTKHQG